MKSFSEKESRMTELKSKTVKSVVPVSINAPIAKVFPLACPSGRIQMDTRLEM
jgi:hypothetical protein